jgi:predicted  nucleic acid-binding Zn-ribbon protein
MEDINELTKAVTELKNILEMYLGEITKEVSMMKEEIVRHRQSMDKISANVERIESKMSKPQGIL